MSNPPAQIKACLADEESYRKNRKPIIQQITAGNKVYSGALVDIVKTTLKDKKEKSIPKFISLYFLKEAMDTQDPELVYAVKDKLLKTLAELAKSDTTKLFLAGTEDKILKNFDQLLLECIIFWAEWFGKDTKGKPTKFQATYDEVFQKVEIPKKFSFFKKKKSAADGQPESGAPKPPAGTSSSSQKAPSSASRDVPPSTSIKTEPKPSANKSSTPGKGGFNADKIEETLKSVDSIKDLLIGTLTEGTPDHEMLALIEDQVKELNRDLQQSLNGLLGQDSSKGEALLNKVLEESNFTSKYLDEYSKLQTGQISMSKFRDIMVNTIMASREKNSPQKEKKKDKEPAAPKVSEPKESKPPKSKFSKPEEPEIKSSTSNKADPFDTHHHHHQSPTVPQKAQKDPFATGFGDFNSSSSKPNAPSAFDSNPFGAFDSAPAAAGKSNNAFDDFGQGSATNKPSAFGDFNSTPAESEFKPAFGKASVPDSKVKNLSIKPPGAFDNEYDTREETKTKENPFGKMWDSNQTDPPKKSNQPRKSDAGFGFEDFGDFKFDDHYNARGGDMDSSQAGGFNFDYDGGVKRTGTPNSVNAPDIFGDTDFSRTSPRKDEFNFGSTKKKDDFEFESKSKKNDFLTFSDPHKHKTDFHSDFDPYKETKPERENYFGGSETIKNDKIQLSSPPKSSILDKLSKIPAYNETKIESGYTHTHTTPHTSGAYISTISTKTYEGDNLKLEGDKIRSELDNVRTHYSGGTSLTPPRDRTPSPHVVPLSEVMTGMNFSPAHTAIENARRAREGGLNISSGPISSSIGGPIGLGGPIFESRISPPRTYLSPGPRLGDPILETRFSPPRVGVSPRPISANVMGESVADIARRVRDQTRVEGAPIYPIGETRILSPPIRPIETPISTSYVRSPALNATIEEARRRDIIITKEVGTPVLPSTGTIYTMPTMVTTGRVISSPPHFTGEENPVMLPRQDYVKPSLLTGLNFVPKYSTDLPQPVVVEEVRAPVRDSIIIEQGLLSNLPDKYTRLVHGGQPNEEKITAYPATVTRVQLAEPRYSAQPPIQQEVNITRAPEPIVQAQNPAWKKTSDLIERARKMRGDAVRHSAGIFDSAKDTKIFSATLVDKADPMHHPNLEALHHTTTTMTNTYNLGRKPSPVAERPGINLSARGNSPLKDYTLQGLNNNTQAIQNKTHLAQTLKNEPRSWNIQGQGDTFGFEGYKTTGKDYTKENIQNVVTQKNAPAARTSETKATKEERREVYQGFSSSFVDPNALSNMRRIDFGTAKVQESSLEKEDARIRQVLGVPSMKYTVADNFMQVTPTNFAREPTPVKGVSLEEGAKKGLTGKAGKVKIGKAMAFDNELFDQFINIIYGYPTFRDIDAFKYACLVNRATVFESPVLQVTSITKNEGPAGPSDEIMKTIVHYTNKASTDIVNFSTFPHDTAVQTTPLVKGVTLTPKYQLKQDFLVGYHDLNCGPYVLDLSYKHEGQTKQMNIVLPITITKYMKFKRSIGRTNFKSVWKRLKPNAVSIGYRKVNGKFLRNPTEINSFFENLCEITPTVNPKKKRKYGGVFVLPDSREYYMKFSLDSSRLKIMGSAGDNAGGSVELVIQYLAFLLTV